MTFINIFIQIFHSENVINDFNVDVTVIFHEQVKIVRDHILIDVIKFVFTDEDFIIRLFIFRIFIHRYFDFVVKRF